jgi:putative hydrolase of the HAD superfamily
MVGLMFKAILFDFDSTLVDYRYGDYLAIDEIRKKVCIYFNSNDFYEKSKKILLKIYENPCSSGTDVNELRIKSLLQELELNYEKQHIKDYYSIYLNTVLVYEGVHDFFKSIIGKTKTGLLTNSIDSHNQRKRIEASKLGLYFDEIGIANEIGYWKPDIESFSWLAEKLHVRNDECIFIGDNEENDIQGANNAGMYTIKRNREDKPKETTIANRTFDTFSELTSIVGEIL